MGNVNQPAEGQSPDPIKVNHIIFVLDKSGSMGPLREATVSNFNEQLGQLKEDVVKNQVNLISLITFSAKIRDVRESVPLSEFDEIKLEEYEPRGNTALYDAIGHAVTKADMGFAKYKNFDNAGLIIILSDGMENRSVEFDNEKIVELIKTRQDGGEFTFTFMGCGEIVRKSAEKIGIPVANTRSFDYNPYSVGQSIMSNACSVSNFTKSRDKGVKQVKDFYAENDD